MSTTTPRRGNMSPLKSPPMPTPRRVLGDLTPRAMNTTPKQTTAREALEAMRARSPLKQVHTAASSKDSDKENSPAVGALNAGKKRAIGEVDGANHDYRAHKMLGQHGMAFAATETDDLAQTVNMDMDFHEDQRVASRGSTTEPDSSDIEAMERIIEASQVSNQSFSAFLNFDACASQPTADEQPPPPPAAKELEQKATRADLLRLRLGLANYKVQTNQVDKTGSEIISTWECSASSAPESLSCPTSSNTTISSKPTSQPVPSNITSPVRRETTNHVKVNLDPGRPIPKLSGGPQLLPTSVSSRMIYDYHLPSSPPDNLPRCVSPRQVMSPGRPECETPTTKRAREGIEDEEGLGHTKSQRLGPKTPMAGTKASTAAKKDVAHGLMELSSGRR